MSHENTDVTISESLTKLFDLQEMTEDQNHILLNFAIIPKGLQIPLNILEFIGFEENALEQLIQSRWISFTENRYLMYDIVWEAVRLQYPQIPYENAKKVIRIIFYSDYFNDNDEFIAFTIKLKIANAYGDYFNDKDDEDWIDFLICIGQVNIKACNYENSLKYNEKALKIQKQSLGTNNPTTALIYNNISRIYSKQKQYEIALEYLKKALKIQKQEQRDKKFNIDITYNNLAEVYSNLRDYENALKNFYKALKVIKETGGSHKEIAIIYSNIARAYSEKEHYKNDPKSDKKALEYFKKALKIQKNANDDYNLAFTYNNLGGFYFKKRQYEIALKYSEKTLRIRERLLGKDHPETNIAYENFLHVSSKLNAVHPEHKKIGVNDPCTCGSGKKYKKCCREKDNNPLNQ